MSASPPPKDAEADQGDHSPENEERNEDGNRDMAYNEFDVKEQDRWLPIANGE
jgi:nuclear transcription Y subunit beta